MTPDFEISLNMSIKKTFSTPKKTTCRKTRFLSLHNALGTLDSKILIPERLVTDNGNELIID